MTLKERLDLIAQREKAASKGPWNFVLEKRDTSWPGKFQLVRNDVFVFGWDGEEGIYLDEPKDAEFISHSRTDIPFLHAALTRALVALEEIDKSDSFYSTRQCDVAAEALDDIEKLAGGGG